MLLPEKNYDLLIFDIDGTLWDITPILQSSINLTLKKHGDDHEVTLATVRSCMGLGGVDFAAKSMPFLPKQTREAYMVEADLLKNETIRTQGASTYEGAAQTIRTLAQKKKICIVSNCAAGYIEVLMEKIGIEDLIAEHIAAYAAGITKAEAIVRVVNKEKATAPVYIGDTGMDRKACREAGVDFIHARYGFDPTLDEPFHIERLSDLLSLQS